MLKQPKQEKTFKKWMQALSPITININKLIMFRSKLKWKMNHYQKQMKLMVTQWLTKILTLIRKARKKASTKADKNLIESRNTKEAQTILTKSLFQQHEDGCSKTIAVS